MTHNQAAQAVDKLRKASTDPKTLSIVGKDSHTEEQVSGYYNAGYMMKY